MRILLVGNPNCGKTTLFNALTGSTAKVGNWPGVTVERKEGLILEQPSLQLIDLPGIYSLASYTIEEQVANDVLLGLDYDCIINIVDASSLERSLYLTSQLMDMHKPMIIVMNMMDILKKRGDTLDIELLSYQLGHPVIELIATKAKGIEKVVPLLHSETKKTVASINWFDSIVSGALMNIQAVEKCNLVQALKMISGEEVSERPLTQKTISDLESQLKDDGASILANARYSKIEKIIDSVLEKGDKKKTMTHYLDQVLMSKWLALPIFFGLMAIVYYVSITSVGNLTIGWVEGITEAIQIFVSNALTVGGANNIIISLVVDGIIGSIGSIFVFVPQLMILFFFISLLEDSGYMARIAIIMDRVFRTLGLSGKSFIPMLIGTGCTTPGIMAARTIENPVERETTILLTPFIPCGAKLPVFAMFLSMLFPAQGYLGALFYLLPFVVVIILGALLKVLRKDQVNVSPFIIELPEYRLPHYHGVLRHMWTKAKQFVQRAGSVIFVAVTILWFLQSFNFRLEMVDISQSILAIIGNKVRYLFIPLGFGNHWAPSVAAITGTIAKEVVVTTFASLSMTSEVVFTQVSAYSFILFITFSTPCVSAVGTMFKELGSIKKTLQHMLFHTTVAYSISFVFYQIVSRILSNTSAMKEIPLDFKTVSEVNNGLIFSNMSYFIIGLFILLGVYVIVSSLVIKQKVIKEYKG